MFYKYLLLVFVFAHFTRLCGDIVENSFTNQSPKNEKDLLTIQHRLQLLLPEAKKSLVAIEAGDGAGSGVIISEDGLVLTAAHVIGKTGKKMHVRLPNGKRVPAVSLGGSEISDAGMLKITRKGTWPFAPIASMDKSKVSDWCFAIGHPGGYDKKRGVVVRLGRVIAKTDETLQSDSRLLGGDSGGPLFNFDGEIIAIHSRISEKSDQNFHVPIECFHTNWEFYRTGEILTFNKLVDMGFLGVGCEKTDAGLIVLNVIKGSAADRIGLVKNDLLLTVDGEKLDSVEELTILISNKQPDESILLEFQRDGIALSEKVTLGARPKEENK
jgi:serine protease Do